MLSPLSVLPACVQFHARVDTLKASVEISNHLTINDLQTCVNLQMVGMASRVTRGAVTTATLLLLALAVCPSAALKLGKGKHPSPIGDGPRGKGGKGGAGGGANYRVRDQPR